MTVDQIIAQERGKQRRRAIELCQQNILEGKLIRNFFVTSQTWGIITSCTIENDVLTVKCGEREGWGHEPFESSIPLDYLILNEDSDGTIFITNGDPSDWKEWKIFPYETNRAS